MSVSVRIIHPREFTYGHRCLFLKARHKDGFETERQIRRYTKNSVEFTEALEELSELGRPGERIYAAAAARDFSAAQRYFKQEMLNADYTPTSNQEEWWSDIKGRWISALMQPNSVHKQDKRWLFDCDTPEQKMAVETAISLSHIAREPEAVYTYKTKNGWHVITRPFQFSPTSEYAATEKVPGVPNKMLGISTLVDRNPMMLWAY